MVKCPKATMIGYLNRPEEEAKFRGKDGFNHTGDLAKYDEEGILYYEGRLKELIKYQNIHIYPQEIEEAILANGSVEEAGVFGTPDELVQELVTAYVVKKPGFETVTEQQLVEFANAKLEPAKQIRGGLQFVRSLPRNPQGKLLRVNLPGN